MTSEPGPALIARIVYLSLVASVLVFTGVATVVRGIQPWEIPPSLVYAPFVVGAVLFGAALACRGRLTQLGQGISEEEWWRANLPRAILVWGLLEGGALFGAVLCFSSRSYLPLAVTGCGLLLLVLTAPSRLTGS